MTRVNGKPKLLIIEDDRGLQSQLRWHFDQYETIVAETRADAIAMLRLHETPVIIQDLGLPPDEDGVDEGFKCIQDILRISPNSKIIVMTGKTDHDNALRAVAMGAYDFYQNRLTPTPWTSSSSVRFIYLTSKITIAACLRFNKLRLRG